MKAELGVAIIGCGVLQEKMFTTTKVVETVEDAPWAIDTSLKKLQRDYLELYVFPPHHNKLHIVQQILRVFDAQSLFCQH